MIFDLKDEAKAATTKHRSPIIRQLRTRSSPDMACNAGIVFETEKALPGVQ
jgi:hypothetical protein